MGNGPGTDWVAAVEIVDALKRIPRARDVLDGLDSEISTAIRAVEESLHLMGVHVPVEAAYTTVDGRFILSFDKWNGQWRLAWGSEADDDATKDITLLGAPRHVRVEVFTEDPDTHHTPMEDFIIAIPAQLEEMVTARRAALVSAKRVVAAFARVRET